MADLSTAIGEYVASRKALGYATNTVRVEAKALDYLLAEVGNISMRSLDTRHGEMVHARMMSSGLKPSTVNLYRGALRRFFKWSQTRRYMPGFITPLGTTRNLSYQPPPRRRIPSSDFNRLLDAAEHPQERVVVALGLYLFLRASEISALNIGHLDLARASILVFQPKTSRWDEMPICAELDTELRRWLTWYAQDQGPVNGPLLDEWPLVPGRGRMTLVNDGTGKCGGRPKVPEFGQVSPPRRIANVHQKVQKTLRTFGWDVSSGDREGVHTLRRSGARALFDHMCAQADVRDGVLRQVGAMLHHKSVQMTELYLGLEADREKRNSLLAGQWMFTPDMENVVELGVVVND